MCLTSSRPADLFGGVFSCVLRFLGARVRGQNGAGIHDAVGIKGGFDRAHCGEFGGVRVVGEVVGFKSANAMLGAETAAAFDDVVVDKA